MVKFLLKLLGKAAYLLGCFFLYASAYSVVKVDFDESMGIYDTGRYHLMLRDGKHSEDVLQFFRNLYNTNFLSEATSSSVKIPRILHQIWIGPKKFPDLYKKYAQTCIDVNPGWEYKLWTNEDVENILSSAPQYIPLFEHYKNNKVYTGQKDLLEYLILYKHGGVFFDADIKCLQSFDSLAYNYDFFSALEPGNGWSKIAIMTNAVVGTKPNNKIFLDTLDDAVITYNKNYENGNSVSKRFARKIFHNNSEIIIPDPRYVFMESLENNLVEKNSEYNERAIVFPATYFNPIMKPINYNIWDNFLYSIGYYKNKNTRFIEAKPETIGVQDFYD